MRPTVFLASAVFAVLAPMQVHAADQNPIACDDPGTVPEAAQAFDSFCSRCHVASQLSRRYFGGLAAGDAARREGELADFLDRHSSCPQRHHEEIAAWLRRLSEAE